MRSSRRPSSEISMPQLHSHRMQADLLHSVIIRLWAMAYSIVKEVPVASEAKQRMLNSAVVLLRERGAAGVSIDAVLAHSGAPRGSVYHHFPGGRAELIISAARLAGDYISGLLDTAIGSGDPARTVTKFSELWKRSLHDSDFRAGCPVVALAVDSRDTLPEAAA